MAGVSSKEIKNRIRSMKSTRQITKAMEMVASSKLRRAQTRVQNSRPYFETLYRCIGQIAASHPQSTVPYLQENPNAPTAVVVIGGDRGLAGGYNASLLKKALEEMENEKTQVLPIGKKALEYLEGKVSISNKDYAIAEDISLGDCFTIAKQLCRDFRKGTVGKLVIVYTHFQSVLVQTPKSVTLLPLPPLPREEIGEVLYEPDADTVLQTIVPEYVGGVLYGALCESRAAEQAARRTAMDAATQNADEMIEDLNLKYNQARQAAITQEITEIIAGG